MPKYRIVVLMGGISSEHEVSMRSGAKVCASLDRSRFDVESVTITRDGLWRMPGGDTFTLQDALPRLCAMKPDCVFLALHGPFGEDGRIQGMLDLLRLPYTGSGCIASGIAMDKIRSKALVKAVGVPVARQLIFSRRDWDSSPGACLERVSSELGFPCVMKSPCQGSSLGMAIPQSGDEFSGAMVELLGIDNQVLIEEFLKGPEVTCGVLDLEPGQRPTALPVTEIVPKTASFFDYQAKYTPGATEEITPARISPEATARVQALALLVHETIGCSGFSRSDMILLGDYPVWLEINTIPGMTETSLLPQAAAVAGILFSELIERLILSSMALRKP